MNEGSAVLADDAGDLAHRAAERVVGTLENAIAARGRARWVLAGGTTPLGLYRLLASRPEALDWSRVEFFWGDERCVPPGDPASNYGAASAAMLDPLAVAPERRRRIRGELPAEEAALEYDKCVAKALADRSWDLVLLGLGSDGHTASLFPPRRAASQGQRWCVAASAPCPPADRVSLTLRALNRTRRVLFLVAGGDKAEAVARVRAGDPVLHAAAIAHGVGSVEWVLDRAAAGVAQAKVQSGRDRG